MNDFEKNFWGNCVNTHGEETKQLVYAQRMGLKVYNDWRSSWNVDLRKTSVIDIGAGPVSLLLKAVGFDYAVVADPGEYPEWVYARYTAANIGIVKLPGEHLTEESLGHFDEAWIYNTLQHVDNPRRIIKNARQLADIIRLFEWIDIPPHAGHPHMLTAAMLDEAFGSSGKTEYLNEGGCTGRAYYGVFKT